MIPIVSKLQIFHLLYTLNDFLSITASATSMTSAASLASEAPLSSKASFHKEKFKLIIWYQNDPF